ncbi:undecaprenyldiphospho-muramoylpentapeptide beta-N-acetylglucosaminyltransferase [uncultured Clostridium sp.]|uniref:undecaprenyldiphospho-muramoylpentapeptide beta-N-acetylglucosaminyltransferase n=1 Tax=uncultured Clostridium sp. TaxID=59620 RepID=UPI0026046C2F|nr:undecaprenyldiphospho-muramoylpentapeptide beta-N-acetylglucosaminyltransferase [uncultured Clostridium sp.]
MSKYKIIMTGGGSAGHVTPNIALMPKLRELGFEIKYIGSKKGIEKEIIAKEGLPYFQISSGKVRRYFDIKNFTDPLKVVKGIGDALKILGKEKPDVVFSKGGFVTVPVIIAASMKKIPVVSHESDFTPGLANKLAMPFCDKLCVTFPESLKHVKGDNGVLTGTPIREELLQGDREKGREFCNFEKKKPTLLIIGGSLGSKIINDSIRGNLENLLIGFNIIHLCGKNNLEESLKGREGYLQFEYISDELPDLMAYTDFVVSRAGANAIFELVALKKPHILIPLSAKASRGDQVLNAQSFKKSGYSMVIEEEELTKEVLEEKLKELYRNKNLYIDNMAKGGQGNGIDNIIKVIQQAVK